MPTSANRVRVQGIDWGTLCPAVKLFGAARLAIQPGKLVAALVAVLVLHFAGLTMDAIWGQPATSPLTGAAESAGVYEAFMYREAIGFEEMTRAAATLDLGMTSTTRPSSRGLLGTLSFIAVETPHLMLREHTGFAVIFGLIALLTLTTFGGMVCRMAATQVCADQTTSLVTAAKYVFSRWLWYVLTPIMPLSLIGLLAVLLIVGGLVFFNLPGLDVVGSILFGLLLLAGMLLAAIGTVLFFGVHLMTPGLSVEGTDGFDIVSRTMNYVLFRPWQLGLLLLVSIIYAAVVYLIIVILAGLSLNATDTFVSMGSLDHVDSIGLDDDTTRFEAIAATAHTPTSLSRNHAAELEGTLGPSAWIMGRWIDLLWAIVAAFMLSLYFTLQTGVYLLIRQSADGTPLDECDAGETDALWSVPTDVLNAAGPISTAADEGQAVPEAD